MNEPPQGLLHTLPINGSVKDQVLLDVNAILGAIPLIAEICR